MTRTKHIRTGIKDVVRAARQRLTNDGLVFHLEAAKREVKLAYYVGKLAAWKDALEFLKKQQGEYEGPPPDVQEGTTLAKIVQKIDLMIKRVEEETSKCG